MNTKNSLTQIALTAISALIIGFVVGQYSPLRNAASLTRTGIVIGVSTSTDSSNPSSPDDRLVDNAQFSPFWSAWKILNSKYISAASTTAQQKVWGAIKGLTSSYGDPYTTFFPPAESKIFAENISGNFSGVGMEIGMKNNQLTVVSPLKGSPAERAGILAGDLVLTIDGTSTAEMSVDEAVSHIRGPEGTIVKIGLISKGSQKPVIREVKREVIKIPTLDTAVLPGGVFLIKLYSFSADSAQLFRNALRDFVLSGNHKLVLDLRGNPGGYLDAAWDMASYFIPIGKNVVTEDFGGNRPPMIFRSKGYNVFNNSLHMLILVDGGSASASEILAGALKENNVAKLVGVKTFGKGSVQELVPLTSDTSLKITIAHWLTPNGHNLSHDGLEPDYQVAAGEKDAIGGTDAQMAKALDILSQQP